MHDDYVVQAWGHDRLDGYKLTTNSSWEQIKYTGSILCFPNQQKSLPQGDYFFFLFVRPKTQAFPFKIHSNRPMRTWVVEVEAQVSKCIVVY